MCGRFTILYTWQQLHRLMRLTTDRPLEIPTGYNIAPTQLAPIVRADGPGRVAELAVWGLTPRWAERPGPINARAETLADKPMFRGPLQKRRCLVPVSGFYEWQAVEGQKAKRPWYIYRADGEPLVLAGLYEVRDEGPSFTIVTTAANNFMAPMHDRMPAVLEPEAAGAWLGSPDTSLLAPAADGVLAAHRVSPAVNRPQNQGPELIAAVA